MSEAPPQVPATEPELSPSDLLKKQGNDAFLAKNLDEAIRLYSEAINVDPDNAILYSNRSACYAVLKDWKKSLEDATTSITKDPKFVKGYYRLAVAQAELGLFSEAQAGLQVALAMEPSNDAIAKLLKAVQNKKTAAQAQAQNKPRQVKKLDEEQMKEFAELQDQLRTHTRDLKTVQIKLSNLNRESRMNAVSLNYVDGLPESVPLYRSVGKAFVLTPRKSVEERLDTERADITKNQRDLGDRQEYLERRIQSVTSNLQDLMK